jgi:histidine ammonia-lyase
MIELDGTGLRVAGVVAIARDGEPVRVTPAGWQRIRDAAASLTGPAYGRTTGVGANKSVAATEGNGLRLLRSHAGGSGPVRPADELRAMLAVRINQFAAGGSGIAPDVVAALIDALDRGVLPPARRRGGIGTGDLTALATTALCLIGEQPWLSGDVVRLVGEVDALPFVSSSAATLGTAALAAADTDRLLRAMIPVASLSARAVDASPEPFAAEVQAAMPYPGQARVAERMRELTVFGPAPGRVQDPYAFRALPQVHGVALDAAGRLDDTVTVGLNAAAENPLAGNPVRHNGNFHTAALTAAIDGLLAALTQAAALSAARLAALVDPALTGLHPFLAPAADGSSGVMILEYVAAAALSELRGLTGASAAAAAGTALSLGTEEHASFATQSADRLMAAREPLAVVAAAELVAAVRALRLSGGDIPWNLGAMLPAEVTDRPLDGDLDLAVALLPGLADRRG